MTSFFNSLLSALLSLLTKNPDLITNLAEQLLTWATNALIQKNQTTAATMNAAGLPHLQVKFVSSLPSAVPTGAQPPHA